MEVLDGNDDRFLSRFDAHHGIWSACDITTDDLFAGPFEYERVADHPMDGGRIWMMYIRRTELDQPSSKIVEVAHASQTACESRSLHGTCQAGSD